MSLKDKNNSASIIVVGVCCFLAVFTPGYAQEQSDENLVNWYYAHEFGTGAYRVGDTTVQIFRVPISYTLKPMQGKSMGVKFVMPFTFGYHNFEYKLNDIIDKIFEEEFATVTVTPGMELEIPFYFDTVMFPYFYAGYGDETSGGTSAWIYGSGVRLLSDHSWRKSKVALGGAFTFAGYRSSDGQDRATTSLRFGINKITPFNTKLFNRIPAWGVHFITFFYFNELDFESEDRQSIQIANEYEIALTLGTKNPMSFLGISFDRMGLAYRWGEELEAVKLVASFPF